MHITDPLFDVFYPQDEVVVVGVEAVEVTEKVAVEEEEEGDRLVGVVEEEGQGAKREIEMIALESSVMALMYM